MTRDSQGQEHAARRYADDVRTEHRGEHLNLKLHQVCRPAGNRQK